MSRFVDEADRSQGTMLPERIDEFVSEENPVRVSDAFVAELDLRSLGFDGMDLADTGGPPSVLRSCPRVREKRRGGKAAPEAGAVAPGEN